MTNWLSTIMTGTMIVGILALLLLGGCVAHNDQPYGWINACADGPADPDDPCAKRGYYPGRQTEPK